MQISVVHDKATLRVGKLFAASLKGEQYRSWHFWHDVPLALDTLYSRHTVEEGPTLPLL